MNNNNNLIYFYLTYVSFIVYETLHSNLFCFVCKFLFTFVYLIITIQNVYLFD